jgi:glycosyltransferase involved in cell wall biosynthesis
MIISLKWRGFKKNMKISYLSNSPLDKKVANAVHVMNMSSSFSKNGHELYLHAKCNCKGKYKLYEEYGVENIFKIVCTKILRIKFFEPLFYGFIQAMKARFIIKPDICYSRCLISAFFAMKFGIKSIVEIHEMPHSRFLKWLYNSILRNENLLRVIVISDGLKIDLLHEYNVKNILVAHDGASIPEIKTPFVLQNNKKINIGYAGGLRDGNGVKLILDLAKELQNFQFHIVGGNPDEITKWQDYQYSDNIQWYGKVEPSKVSAFLQKCDILLAPYQVGPKTASGRDTARWMSPLKIFEYMASGKAMIVSRFEVLEEVLNDENSILVEAHNFLEWKSALEKLATNNEHRETIGKNAYKILSEKYTWQQRAKMVIKDLNI